MVNRDRPGTAILIIRTSRAEGYEGTTRFDVNQSVQAWDTSPTWRTLWLPVNSHWQVSLMVRGTNLLYGMTTWKPGIIRTGARSWSMALKDEFPLFKVTNFRVKLRGWEARFVDIQEVSSLPISSPFSYKTFQLHILQISSRQIIK